MRNVKLLCDSTSDLPAAFLTKHNIGVIPLYVNFGTRSFKDNVDISPRALYDRVAESGQLPTTSAPTPEDYQKEFEKYIKKSQDVIYISISSHISSSFQNACTAAALFPAGRVTVIDSLNLSAGIGLLVMTAADSLQKGLNAAETATAVQVKTGRVETEFILDTVEYLHKGGRCSGLQMFFSSLLKIHPIIAVANGSMHLAAKVRGGRRQVLEHLLKSTVDNLDQIDAQRIFVAHSECPEDAAWLIDKLNKLDGLNEILITEASCVISTHCGPRTVGIMYLKK